MVRAKICGLSTVATLEAAITHGASHVGFVFFPKSPRNVTPASAEELAARTPDHVVRVGVFVDPDDALLERIVPAARLGAIQLHGRESADRVAAIKARFGVETWKAVAIRTRADLDITRSYRSAADRIVYDARTPEGADLPGGMGLRFDWRLLEGFDHPLRWVLSGGLDAGNVAEAVAVTGATTVDVSSGVESAPGIKDVDKIAAFLQSVTAL